MKELLLDTDTVSFFLRNEPAVMIMANDYLKDHGGFTMSVITRFEILRGLQIKSASSQLAKFQRICVLSRIISVTDAIAVRASEIYSDLHRNGQIIGDADILIAATAIENNLAVATNNTSHFERISGLEVNNWLS